MQFRPYPVLTLLSLPVLGALIWLGVWQASRAEWKSQLIAAFEAAAADQPVAAGEICGATPLQGQIVLPPESSGPVLRVFGQNAAGATGWREFQASQPCGEATVLIQTGFEPLIIGDLPLAPQREAATRFMVEPVPPRSFMAAPNMAERNEWHWFDLAAMSAELGGQAIENRYILVPFEGVPDYLLRTPPSRHIGYSVTWFGMAAALVLLYAAFHTRAGRLRFRKPDTEA